METLGVTGAGCGAVTVASETDRVGRRRCNWGRGCSDTALINIGAAFLIGREAFSLAKRYEPPGALMSAVFEENVILPLASV